MQSIEDAKIIRFPIEKRLNRESARKKLGRLMDFRYPDTKKIPHEDIVEWLDAFLIGKKVLLCWSPINRGLVDAFKQGNVCHIISHASVTDMSRKPLIEVCCKSHEMLHVHNWQPCRQEMSAPAVLLSLDQSNYFRVCLKCAAYLRDHAGIRDRR